MNFAMYAGFSALVKEQGIERAAARAAALGFSSDKAFIGFFKYHEGCFPTEFRDRFGKIHMNSR